ncbi:hypothetical protein HPP92_020882 [Vanilla planifolia]|uniref:Uncharacterized protein n=1 Tax=Vanilla planifolia TaxID=51239 RepID=A0A835UH16_VANPL|nr:hypothetical protein HPP92_020882 [Vanilla planifolia]
MSRPPPLQPPWPHATAASGGSSGGVVPTPVYFLATNNYPFACNPQNVQLPLRIPQPSFQNPTRPVARNPSLPSPRAFHSPPLALETIELTAAKAQMDLAIAGEHVSAWKDVPTLRRLLLTEGKVNAFIHCFVCARKITSVYELEAALCKNEGINQFEELGMGPFLRHPLVKHYFSVPSELTEVFKINSEDIIISLQTFMNKHTKKVSAEEFVVFLAKEKSVSVKENLGVRIQNIGYHVHLIREAVKAENTVIREKLNEVKSCRGGNHVYFNSSDEGNATQEEDDDNSDGEDTASNNKYQSISHDKGYFPHVNSCPYPSKTEELMRLGLNTGKVDKAVPTTTLAVDSENRKPIRKKRKSESTSTVSLSSKYQKKVEKFDLDAKQQLGDLTLSNGDIEKFVTTWKAACQKLSVTEVLDMMLHYYVKANEERRKINKLLSSYPVIGMLNVAVFSIKQGMLGSLYDTLQALSEKEMERNCAVSAETIDVRPEVEDSFATIANEFCYSVPVDDIIKKIKAYFENDRITHIRGLPSLKLLSSLKMLHDCELGIMLSQAEANLMAKGDASNVFIFSLLRKQFPTACFHFAGEDLNKYVGDLINRYKESEEKWHRNLLSCKESSLMENGGNITGIPQQTVRRSSKEATDCLLKAPMLSDLQYWSHWDLIYAPSLGPLSDWLLNKFNSKELLCIATIDGKFIRIDHSATVDDFLQALVQCSAFDVALKLLSLLCMYRGTSNAPVALLKCYAQKAVDVIVKNSTDSVPINSSESGFIPEHIGLGPGLTSSGSAKCFKRDNESCQQGIGFCTVDKAIAVVSRITLECLHYLPSEFRNVTADILLSGLRPITKRAPVIVLNECRQTDERMMLHEIGLSLGLTEWVMDYHEFSSFTVVDLSKKPDTFDELSLRAVPAILQIDNNCDSSSEIDLKGNDTLTVGSSRKIDDNVERQAICKANGTTGIFSEEQALKDATAIIESIRCDEFGLDSNTNQTINHLLMKQHARLGRALHCLSQELYSQDSHFILELVTDAPEIHSNGFHVKFDITEGQIGFVLPTVVPPCDLSVFKPLLSHENYQRDCSNWKTCILLPFRPRTKGGAAISSIISMFSDLHPSLLLFLHRLRCIKFKNLLNNKVAVMRKETHDDGIVKVYHGEEVTTWLVVSKKLQCSIFRTDVESTEISVAFTLLESLDGEYNPCLHYQPVFAFLPLRNYGLKFILQGDFVLPSSREEVDGDSAWNQWLLSEFPSLFVSAEQFFCSLPYFQKCPGKAVNIYMSFVPLVGEVHGFFSQLPHMITSLLRLSKCLLQESSDLTWILPCRALRGWNEQVRLLLSDHLLEQHTGLVYLHKDVKLSDTLSADLGIQDYGPKVLVEVISSICHSPEDMKSL